MKSIKTKLILIIGILIMSFSIIIGTLSYSSSIRAVEHEVESALMSAAQEGAMIVSSKIETQLTFLETISENYIITDDTPLSEKLAFLQKEAERMGFDNLAIVDLKGEALKSDGETTNVFDREYFKKAVKGISNASDIIISSITGEPIVIYAVPIKRNNQVTGIIYGVRNGAELSNITNQIKYGDHGYAYMINKDGTTIAHSNIDLVLNFDNIIENAKENVDLKQLATIMEEEMLNRKAGVGSYVYNGVEKVMGYSPVPGTDWSLAVTTDIDEVYHSIYQTRNIIFLSLGALIIIGLIVAIILGRSISKPIIYGVAYTEKLAEGDFTAEIPPLFRKRKDEIGRLAQAFAGMRDNLKGLIQQAVAASETVGASSQELSASIDEVSTSIQSQASALDEVSSSMEEISANAVTINENMQYTVKDVGTIVDTMGEVEKIIAENSSNLENINYSIGDILSAIDRAVNSLEAVYQDTVSAAGEANETQELAVEGKKALDKTVRQMEAIQTMIVDLSEVIDNLGTSAVQIGEITDLIKDVAEQTNLLALNASIEAARAGEHGRGFAVVAQSIGDLAQESQNAAKDISKVIVSIQNEIDKAVKRSNAGRRVAQNGAKVARGTSASLDRIFDAIKNTSEFANKITDEMNLQTQDFGSIREAANVISDKVSSLMAAMEEETASATEIKNRIDSISRLLEEIGRSIDEQSRASEHISDGINENAAGLEQISVSSEDIAKGAEDLSVSAQKLLEHVSRFKV